MVLAESDDDAETLGNFFDDGSRRTEGDVAGSSEIHAVAA